MQVKIKRSNKRVGIFDEAEFLDGDDSLFQAAAA